MDKRPDFGKDLVSLTANVEAEVGDVLDALRQKKSTPPRIVRERQVNAAVEHSDAKSASAETPTENGATASERRMRSARRSRLRPVIERDEILENVTTRLPRATNELLTEAALRQRLKKELPATRQDIVEAALTDWFRKHGYRTVSADHSEGANDS